MNVSTVLLYGLIALIVVVVFFANLLISPIKTRMVQFL
jgi:hypothetical protein